MASHVSLGYHLNWILQDQALSVTPAVQAGDCIIVCVHTEKLSGAMPTINSVTDSAGNTYTVRAAAESGDANKTKQHIVTAIAGSSGKTSSG